MALNRAEGSPAFISPLIDLVVVTLVTMLAAALIGGIVIVP